MSGASLRLAVDCKKAFKRLARGASGQFLGKAFVVKSGARHDVKVYFDGALRPIPLDCHDFDKFSDHLVGQFAKAVGASRQQVIGALISG